MHSAVDSVVTNVTNALKTKGMYANTVFILSTDNGGTFEHTGVVPGSSNYPLRGHKYSYFEGGIRGAAFVHSPLLPQSVVGTRTMAGPMHISDWYATFCALAGISADDGYEKAPLDGVNIWPLIVGNTTVRPAVAWQGGPGQGELMYGIGGGKAGALRKGPYKLIVGGQAGKTDGWSAQYPGSTPIVPPPHDTACGKAPCLFNVEDDQREMNDLSATKPDIAKQMLGRYQQLADKMNVPNGHEGVDQGGDKDACVAMHKHGFYVPWKENP
eukprot:NODE_370_length_960_cov_207.169654_g363_i0.p1 GENE.NODE_370_length_960_cov_207.169654_g363_i0~~NODE_370_length_960_cov_207.169654_g363_i0.p1  ORF type:complete len:305 (+),score=56.67 NODE_370_length_960_cov_207.169654_g363_i0:106-915(+)